MPAKPLPPWFRHLEISESICVLLAAAQSRYASVLVDKLGYQWSAEQIEIATNALLGKQAIELDSLSRVRLRVTCKGRNLAARARERAQKLEKRKAAA